MKAASLEINNPNHGKLSKIWVQMGELLESENMKKTEISTKIKRMIESSMMKQLPRRTNKREIRIKGGYFYKIMGEHNWLNPKQQHPYAVPKSTELEAAAKNIQFDKQLKRLKRCITWILFNSKKSAGIFERRKYQIVLSELSSLITGFEDAANQKAKVGKLDQLLFIDCIFLRDTIKNAMILYHQKKIEIIKKAMRPPMSKRAVRGYVDGEVPEIPALMHPTDRDTAIFAGYWGVQHKACKGWRVQPTNNLIFGGRQVKCIDCDNLNKTALFKAQTLIRCPECGFIFYDSILKKVRENEKCPKCDIDIQLPPAFS